MPKEKFQREPEGRFDRDENKRPAEDKLYPEPESPFETVILSPSMVKINEFKPSFDVLAPEFAKVIVPAFVQFVKGGASEITSSLTTDHSGLVTFEYAFKDPRTSKTTQDFWDYQGPMKLKFKTSFLGKPPADLPEEAVPAVQKFFLAGGYDDTDAVMRAQEEVLASLRHDVKFTLLNFAVNPFLIPFSQKKAYRLKDADFVHKILAAKPELFVHWRVS